MQKLRFLIAQLLVLVAVFCFAPTAWAFCGFYVSKADAKLYNKASQIVIAHSGERTVVTMANDYQGEVKDFALVVPVPSVLQKDQVHVAEPKIVERLDAFSAPRLIEYFDSNPCEPVPPPMPLSAPAGVIMQDSARSSRSTGVTVEARFNVGEYDIVILSAKESGGLETWLNRNGYKIPRGAKQLLKPYIRSSMKFFVAKVNLDKFEQSGYQYLRPLQISYSSSKFMLPIRLGMINSTAEQDLIVYALSPKGQTEVTNYRTVKVASDANIPLFVKDEFANFYKSMFQTAYTREDKKVAFLEYAWDMSSCDPCSADPLTSAELKQAGVFWLGDDNSTSPGVSPPSNNVFITRLHVRYTRNKFPEDLMFQETSNQESFQGRYILQHPYAGELKCKAGSQYKRSLSGRFDQEAQTLAKLTNWDIQQIREKMKLTVNQFKTSWWQNFVNRLGFS